MSDTPLPVQDLREIYAIYADTYLTLAGLSARLASLGLDIPAKNAHSLSTRCYVMGSGIRGMLLHAEGEAGQVNKLDAARVSADAIMDGAEPVVVQDVVAEIEGVMDALLPRVTEALRPILEFDLSGGPPPRPPLAVRPKPARCILGHSMPHDAATCRKCGSRRDDEA